MYEEFLLLAEDVYPELFTGLSGYIDEHGGIDGLTKRRTNYPKDEDVEPNEKTLHLLHLEDAFSLEMDFYKIVKAEFLKQYYNAFGLDRNRQHKSKIQYNQIHNWEGKMNAEDANTFRDVNRK